MLGRCRHSTPPGAAPKAAAEGQPDGTEGQISKLMMQHRENFIDDSGTAYGPPARDVEPRPHARQDIRAETTMEFEPMKWNNMRFYFCKRRGILQIEWRTWDVNRMENAAMVGDEGEASNLRIQVAWRISSVDSQWIPNGAIDFPNGMSSADLCSARHGAGRNMHHPAHI